MLQLEKITTKDYTIKVLFQNGEEKTCDISVFLDRGIFQELKNKNLFAQAKNTGFSIEWPNGADLSSDTLYAIGK